MTGRGGKRRGRPPKTVSAPSVKENDKKFQYHLLKKPKYLQNRNESRFSTPSRASSPQDSEESSRKSFTRTSIGKRSRGKPRKNKRGGHNNSYVSRKSYNSPNYNKTDYHYGSDFGDSSEKSEDELAVSASSSESLENDSDSDFSLSEFSNASYRGNQNSQGQRSVTPDLLWLKDDIDIPKLELPPTSDDLLVPKNYVLKTVGVYEILRRYRNLARLSPFRLEDFCAALMCEDQSNLLVEIHIALLKAILREEDSQQTHFGPLDQKDSVNISLYLIDNITWPEVLRSYVESDPSFDKDALEILTNKEYPYTDIDDRLLVLQLLTDQFLTTTSVRDDMIQEGPIHYDDHCRICHRLGDLLCCETCPAVFHLECVDPPLTTVPSEDWQCGICKSHAVSGVVDCIVSQEKQGLLCRQDHLGFDRHGRKYWFVCRRIFVETEDGSDMWYYSVPSQFEQVIELLDATEMEKDLYKTIEESKEEIMRQMGLTESITEEEKGNKKSYLELEVEKIKSSQKDKEEKMEVDENPKNGAETEDIEETLAATEINKEEPNAAHLTRSKSNQITNGTFYFKLGMENSFKTYSNQFTTNQIALNKPQKNEERDKKRHLSHKFSLTQASDFKWIGNVNGTQAHMINVLKQTLLTFEQGISQPYMHCNWAKLRKTWLNAVAASSTPQDFSKVLIVLQTCFKSVIFANVWHEQLGHTKLYRITSTEREERKKLEKREKRERDDEEERYRSAYNFVKYSLGLKHQAWKQKGEEYRIHGQWGWLWSSRSRRSKYWNNIYKQRILHVNVVVQHDSQDKILCLKRQTYENLNKVLELSKNLDTEHDEKYKVLNEIKVVDVSKESSGIINVSEALKAQTRVIYPKVAKKSALDDLLARREKLRDQEIAKTSEVKTEEIPENVIPKENSTLARKKFVTSNNNTQCVQRILQDIIETKNKPQKQKVINTEIAEKCQKIHELRSQLKYIQEIFKHHKCYSRNCRNGNTPINLQSFSPCYSNLCLKEVEIKKQIAQLIQTMKEKNSLFNGKKQSILHQKLTENKNNDLMDLLQKYHLWDYVNDEYYQYDLTTCLNDLSSALKDASVYDEKEFYQEFVVKAENLEEVKKEEDIKEETEKEKEKEEPTPTPGTRINRRFPVVVPKTAKKEKEIEKELYADGKEKIFATESPKFKVYLKKPGSLDVVEATVNGGPKEVSQEINKYPIVTNFNTVRNNKNILVLPKYEQIKMARKAGKMYVNGFHHQAKNNNSVWPYPCPRPLFRHCWIYRTFNLNSFACMALQLRIIWTCMRWDDMQTKPPTTDGKNQVTTETEILTTELLKHRFVGMFLERAQYLRRKIVIPLELPKTVREVNPIRSGLRKRKRAESPVQTEPQVSEEWIDEDKLELWEIKQYGEKQDKVSLLPTTRTSTGKLPAPRTFDDGPTTVTKTTVISSKQTPDQIKEKMEEQLKLQRAARNQKRTEEMRQQQATPTVKTITKRIIVKNADGTQKIIHQQITTPISSAESPSAAPSPIVTPQKPEPQKVQIIRGPDGKVSVRGLNPGQQLMQTPDGKLHVISSPQSQASPYKTIIPRVGTKPATATVQSTTPIAANVQQGGKILIRQQVAKPQFIATSTPQKLLQRGVAGQKIIVNQSPVGMQKVLVTSPTTPQQMGEKRIIIQNAGGQQQQQIILNRGATQFIPTSGTATVGQQIIFGNQKYVLSPVSGQQQQQPQQTTTTTQVQTQQIQQPIQLKIQQTQQIQQPEQPKQPQQIVVQNSSIAQQLAEGKIQLANFNGQQVLIKQIGNGQAQIVGHVKSGGAAQTTQLPVVPVQQQVQQQPQQQQQQIIKPQLVQATSPHAQQTQVTRQIHIQHQPVVAQAQAQSDDQQLSVAFEQSLLVGQPPGTIIKCVTAQVVQTNNGPRIVLQGLQGSDFTQQQTQMVQQQVKQQLLKAQESNGKQGVLGPTKIYLAIQPQLPQSQPPPLAPVLQQQEDYDEEQQNIEQDDIIQEDCGDENDNNGDSLEGGFVLTPAYIQDTIKTVLKQGNLNPEIEEKLLTLQRYQEKQMKGEPFDASNFSTSSHNSRNIASPDDEELFDDNSHTSTTKSYRKRRDNNDDDDEEWCIDTPKKRPPKTEKSEKKTNRDYLNEFKKTIIHDKAEQQDNYSRQVVVKTETSVDQIKKNIIINYNKVGSSGGFSANNLVSTPTDSKERMNMVKREIRIKAASKIAQHQEQDAVKLQSKLHNQLNKHKENLKKMILKKRDILEKQLQNEIQKELSIELASHIKNVCQKQEQTKKEAKAKKRIKNDSQSSVHSSHNPQQLDESGELMMDVERPREKHVGRPRKNVKSNVDSSVLEKDAKSSGKKKQKIYCVCRKPYDRTKFYIGCDLCNNWFHGECVGITEEQSKTMTEFVCTECEKAKDSKELFCLCRTPYDASLFYICCDKCQDWFHGKCVGILQSEADYIDEYICPNCQKDKTPSNVNLKNFNEQDFEELRMFLKDIQAHKSSWPFMEAVDASEVPDYYKVIKEPMDLKQIESKILDRSYSCLSDFIKDMAKIFDNCRYYNSKDSSFCKCAESLETYFTQKLNGFRDNLIKSGSTSMK